MKHPTSRILIETILKKSLREMKESPERNMRNLIDLALQFSKGRFQHDFFETAQTMLKNESSLYYALVQDIIANTNHEKLLTFGLNLGYNSCTRGAQTIREIEKLQHFNIPWCISLHINHQHLSNTPEKYDSIIKQGNQLGVYTWMLFSSKDPGKILPLISKHLDNAFILFCIPEQISDSFYDACNSTNNVMPTILYNENTYKVCMSLRQYQIPYSIYYCYDADNIEIDACEHMIRNIEVLHPIFTALIANQTCLPFVQQKVYDFVLQARKEQIFKTILWEFECDNRFVDSIISEDSCLAEFDENGRLYGQYHLYEQGLHQILRQAFPKNTHREEQL